MLQCSGPVQLALVAALSGSLVEVLALPGWAQEQQANDLFSGLSTELNRQANQQGADWSLESEWAGSGIGIPQLSEFEQPATKITDWIAQIEASLVQITNVRVEATEAGLQVILETDSGSLEVPETRAVGNALIADIANATLAEEFSQANPIEGIALVNVTQLPGERVRVAITGTNAPPIAEITTAAEGLAFVVTVGTAAVSEAEALELVVTGEQDEGYNPSSATTATRTDTPLRDIPQSITVVPRQVLDDRNVRTVTQAVETVAGVVDNFSLYNSPSGNRLIRGFNQQTLRNGLRDDAGVVTSPFETIEQVEVLRGPASVLFGALEPGGIINVITRQPLDEPYYRLGKCLPQTACTFEIRRIRPDLLARSFTFNVVVSYAPGKLMFSTSVRDDRNGVDILIRFKCCNGRICLIVLAELEFADVRRCEAGLTSKSDEK
ncbi:TonB-dependent receptor plug domain-containing protein [Leptolyngbya sp. 7M]|uniref:TonB-dependent receptor plug domain-containing protein n=1 Tax=Leptolyngbya sp. 7M TaxID=2812896 RepID=UPI001B8CE8B0|nr:TonB-dependent receptor plug domain-containing protein [Leptolyngbya sp. 7M]QYO61981.1 TonB-dependent receptor plug domain-containing protein [Leptolyngbya sp. 7M]